MLQYACQLLMYDGCNMVAVWPYLKVVIHQWDGKVAIWYFGNVPIYLPGELLARLPFTCFYTQSSIYVSLTWLCRATLHFDCLARSHKAPKSGALGAWGSIWQPCEKVTKKLHGKVAIYLQDNQNVCMLAGLLEGHQKVSIGTILQRCKALPLAPKALCLEPFCKLANVTLHFGRIVSFWQLMLQYFFDIFSIFRYFFNAKHCQKLTLQPICKVPFASSHKGSKRSFLGAKGSVLQRCEKVPIGTFWWPSRRPPNIHIFWPFCKYIATLPCDLFAAFLQGCEILPCAPITPLLEPFCNVARSQCELYARFLQPKISHWVSSSFSKLFRK